MVCFDILNCIVEGVVSGPVLVRDCAERNLGGVWRMEVNVRPMKNSIVFAIVHFSDGPFSKVLLEYIV